MRREKCGRGEGRGGWRLVIVEPTDRCSLAGVGIKSPHSRQRLAEGRGC